MAQQRQELKGKLDARVEAARTWARRVKAELAVLPDTLEKLREGATSFQAVGQRLEATSASLEELTDLYGKTLGAAVRRSSSAAEALQQQLAKLPSDAPAAPDLLTRDGRRPPADDGRPGGHEPVLADDPARQGDEGGQEASAAQGLTPGGQCCGADPEASSKNACAAGDSTASRWTIPMSRHSGGSSGATTAPCVARHRGQRPGQHGDAGTGQHEGHDRLALVGLDRDPRRRADLGERHVEQVPGRRAHGLAHERLGGERAPARGAGAASHRAGGRPPAPGARAGGSRCARRPRAPR